MWDVKLKAANEQTRWTNKQKLIDTDNSMMVTRGKGEEAVESKGGEIHGDGR